MDVAAIVIELIEGDESTIVLHQKYMDKLFDICKKGILFVSAEV